MVVVLRLCYLAIKKASRYRESVDTGAPREIRTPGLWIFEEHILIILNTSQSLIYSHFSF